MGIINDALQRRDPSEQKVKMIIKSYFLTSRDLF